MIELSAEKKYTLKEVRDSIEIPRVTLQDIVKRLFPSKMVKGKTTYLTESEVALVSEESKKAHNTDLTSTRHVATTQLEENKVIMEGYKILQSRQVELTAKVKELKPKADKYITLMDTGNNLDVEAFAKSVGYGRNNLFKLLRKHNYIMLSSGTNMPYQRYIDQGLFDVVQVTKGSHSYSKTLITKKGVDYLMDKLNLTKSEQLTFL